jgi:cytochrome c5
VKSSCLLPGILLLAAIGAATLSSARGATPPAQPSPKKPAHHSAASTSTNAEDEGERIFAQNCSRCHNAPEGFSPRISGTIVRHMRVRANLSEHDEQALLNYLNP